MSRVGQRMLFLPPLGRWYCHLRSSHRDFDSGVGQGSRAQAVGVGLEHAGVVVELADFFHDRGDLVADAFVQRGHIIVVVQAPQADD